MAWNIGKWHWMKKRTKRKTRKDDRRVFEKSHHLKCWLERSERHKTERVLIRKRQRASHVITPTKKPKEKEPWGGTYWIHFRSKSCIHMKLPLGQCCKFRKKTTTSKTKHWNTHTNTSLKDWELKRDWLLKFMFIHHHLSHILRLTKSSFRYCYHLPCSQSPGVTTEPKLRVVSGKHCLACSVPQESGKLVCVVMWKLQALAEVPGLSVFFLVLHIPWVAMPG